MVFQILIVSIIIILCIMANKFSDKIGIPSLLLFLLLGIVFGTNGIFKIPFDNYYTTQNICTISLIFIMFYGGFGTNWSLAKKVAKESFLLSTIGVVITAGLTGFFAHFVLKFEILESLLVGAVLSSTDAASMFAILRSKNLNLKNGLASILELESGSNDPTAYMLTIVILGLMSKTAEQFSVLYMIFSQIAYGVFFGFLIAFTAIYILKKFSSELDTVFVLATALLSYALSSLVGGNGYLTVYIVGIILGNSKIKNKVPLVHFFDGVTGLMQIVIFFLLGLLSFPSEIPKVILPSIGIVLFLTFIGRPIAVFSILTVFKKPFKEQLLISLAGIRGVASIVFAILAVTDGGYMKNDLFHIVFFLVLVSVSFQGTLLPFISKKLRLVDKNENVLKTFSDYVDEDYGLIEIHVSPNHSWKNKKIKELDFPLDSIAVMISRGGQSIIPVGGTVIKENDDIILNCRKYKEYGNIDLAQIKIDKNHPWKNKSVKELNTSESGLIIMIKRENISLIPNGDTVIKYKDILVLNKKPGT